MQYVGRAAKRFALVLLALLLGGCMSPTAQSAVVPTLTGDLVVTAPTSINVGDPAQIRVMHVNAPEGLRVVLVTQGSYGVRVYRAAFAGGTATFMLPGEDTRQSGLVTLSAVAGAARGNAQLAIHPGPPAEPLMPLVGPRSIVADGDHWTMVTVVPFDSYSNPMADGTPVELRVAQPGVQPQTLLMQVQHLVAWRQIWSGTQAGRTTLSVTAADAHGPDAIFQEVPGWPAPFTLSASPPHVPADGRQFVTLRTSVIHDRFGNPQLDGTLITFVVETPGGVPRQIPAYTLDGVAEAQLQAPEQPGTLTVRATLFGIESAALPISFGPGPAVGRFPLIAHVNAREGVIMLEAGPLLGPLDQFVPDGTPVLFRLHGPDNTRQDVVDEAEQGYARSELLLTELHGGSYTVDAQVGTGRGATAFKVP